MFGIVFVSLTHCWFDESKIISKKPEELSSPEQIEEIVERAQLKVSFSEIFNHYKRFFIPTFRL